MQSEKQIQAQEQKEELTEEQLGLMEKIKKEKTKGKMREELRSLAIFLGLMAAATAGRVALQWVPSVEPIIPLAVMAGMLFGAREGFALGAGAYTASNFFVWGLQGPWTIFQALGAGIAGALGGLVGKTKKPSSKDLIIISVMGTAVFEVIMNLSGSFMGIGLAFGLLGIPLYFLTSMPFTFTHIGSNIVFAKLFSPLLKLRRQKDEFKIISVTKLDPNGKRTTIRMYKSEQ
ncbi:MAG: hypothetical protein AB1467_03515 [Candidatus Diapherotrites archaeon]